MSPTENLLKELENQVSTGNVEGGTATLKRLKVALLEKPNPSEHCLALEYGVLLAVADGDLEAFNRNMQQLQVLYQTETTQRQNHILGLNLMFLLVENRLSEFHSQLELLPNNIQDPFLLFPVTLERDLMVGRYDELLESQVPHPSFQIFMDHLLETVRDNIADAMEVSYKSIGLESAATMMKFHSKQELLEYMEQSRADWIVTDDGRLEFSPPVTEHELPSMEYIHQSLTYATEMERIV